MLISFIIPTHNSGDSIEDCLNAISRQKIGKDAVNRYETIIVDDGSMDETISIAEKFPCRIVRTEKTTIAKARNIGAREAKGGILFFIDSDIILPDNALSIVSENLKSRETAAVFGIYSKDIPYANFTSQYKNLYWVFNYLSSKENEPVLSGAIIAIKRKAFFAVDGFNETFKGETMEDFEFGMRLKEAGFGLCNEKRLQAVHKKPLTFHKMLRMTYKKALGASYIAKNAIKENSLKNQISVLVPMPVITFFALSVLNIQFALYGLALFLMFVVSRIDMLSFFRKERGIMFSLKSAFALFSEMLVAQIGIGIELSRRASRR